MKLTIEHQITRREIFLSVVLATLYVVIIAGLIHFFGVPFGVCVVAFDFKFAKNISDYRDG